MVRMAGSDVGALGKNESMDGLGNMGRLWHLAAAVVALGTVAGCSVWPFGGNKQEVCPPMVGLEDAVRQVKFQRGGGRDLTDIEHIVAIQGVSGECEADFDERQLSATVIVEMTAESGPADVRREGLIRYFVALVGPNRQILHREPRNKVFRFPKGSTRIIIREPVELDTLPLTVGDDVRRYRIVAGLTLNRQELEYNRNNQGPLP